jgi:hypothetical protein
MMPLVSPGPGVALLGTFGGDNSVNASIAVSFYGDDAEVRAAASHVRGRTG